MNRAGDVASLRRIAHGWRQDGQRIGLVPTMGALHDGHMSLITAAQRECDRVIVSIFVNPMQFNNPDDLAKYPRTEARDGDLLHRAGVDLLFLPTPAIVYPAGFSSVVSVAGLSTELEGAHRPGHFDGMTTVVAKLFLMTGADRAYFGEKDWQQLQIVRRMVADLNIPVQITGCPTFREPDGLAMASRNLRLTPGGRQCAPALHRAMMRAAAAIIAGTPVHDALDAARNEVLTAGFDSIDYIALHGAEDLRAMSTLDRPARLLAAAWIGGVRLIDNIAVGSS